MNGDEGLYEIRQEIEKEEIDCNKSYCYLIKDVTNKTYIGATCNIEKRLKQHNGILSGGAKYTKSGTSWKYVCIISDIPEWRSALQIEWKWKNICRTKYKNIKCTITRRLYALKYLLSLEKPTTNSIPYHLYPNNIVTSIIWYSDEHKNIYDAIII
jgi:predicted GIY-YIG superfamily endonuclease